MVLFFMNNGRLARFNEMEVSGYWTAGIEQVVHHHHQGHLDNLESQKSKTLISFFFSKKKKTYARLNSTGNGTNITNNLP
jgi:demethoxyubiquinone hydroxylase (CLK1/Coq7/Cat5 family)